MPTLKDLVQARKHQTELSNVDADTYRMALQRTYEAVAHDVWGGQEPKPDEYVLVVLDRLELHGGLTPDEYRRFSLLGRDVKWALALAVGP